MSAIMKIQFGKSKREKTLLSILIAIIIVAIYFHIFLRPDIASLGALLPKVSMLQRELVDARSLIANRDIIEEEGRKLQIKIDRYKEIFPGQQEIPKFLESLSDIAGESDVRIIGIKPFSKRGVGLKQEGQIYQEIPVEIVAKSGYHQLGRFLQKLESGDRFIMVKDIKISTNPHNIKRHNVRLIASTYILIKE